MKAHIVPVEIQPIAIPPEMRMQLTQLQRLDLATDWDEGIMRLLNLLRKTREAKTSTEIGIAEEGRKKMQAIMADPKLSAPEKAVQFGVTLSDELLATKLEALVRWRELDQRRDELSKAIDNTSVRLLDLLKERDQFEGPHVFTQHTEEILQSHIRELKQKRAALKRNEKSWIKRCPSHMMNMLIPRGSTMSG
jgi:hypothetical protein